MFVARCVAGAYNVHMNRHTPVSERKRRNLTFSGRSSVAMTLDKAFLEIRREGVRYTQECTEDGILLRRVDAQTGEASPLEAWKVAKVNQLLDDSEQPKYDAAGQLRGPR